MNKFKEGQAVYWTDPYTHECNVYSVLRIPPQDSDDTIILIGNNWSEKEVWESELTLVNGIVKIDSDKAIELWENDRDIYVTRADGSESMIEDEEDLHDALNREEAFGIEGTGLFLDIVVDNEQVKEAKGVCAMLSFIVTDTMNVSEYTAIKIMYLLNNPMMFAKDAYMLGVILQQRFEVNDYLYLIDTL